MQIVYIVQENDSAPGVMPMIKGIFSSYDKAKEFIWNTIDDIDDVNFFNIIQYTVDQDNSSHLMNIYDVLNDHEV